jgi:outer membrane protein OmpA-like peptidoglycan-associated protein
MNKSCALALLSWLAITSAALYAADESVLAFKPEIQRGDIYKPQGLWPLLGVGAGVMDTGNNARTGGVPMHVKVLGSYYFEGAPWVADAGVGLHNEFLTQDGGGSDTITSLYTELAARYEMTNRWQVGAIWNTLVDNPHRYHSNNDNLASFMGAQVLKEFTYQDRYLVRAGGRAMTSIGLRGESINTLMGEIEVSFGNSRKVAEKPVENATPVVEAAAVAPHLATHAMQTFQLDPGPVHFESDSTKLVGASQRYMTRLAHALAANHELFQKVGVVGHTDQRGTSAYNVRLSENRATAVANTLISAGVNKGQIHTIPKGKSELLSTSMAPAALARNRRVELEFEGVKNQAALKNVIDSVKHE